MENILNIQTKKIKVFMSIVLLIIIGQVWSKTSLAEKPIKLIVDGKNITSTAKPIIENSRTLVPVRFVAEEIGGKVNWNNEERLVEIGKDNSTIILRIDSHLVRYEDGKEEYFLSDISPKIVDGRTYVPLRLVSNALGIGVNWDEENRSINIDSKEKSDFTPIFYEEIATIESGQTISGRTELEMKLPNGSVKDGAKIKYLLLDPKTAKGDIIAIGGDIKEKYNWLPSVKDNGEKILVAAIYDEDNKLVGGDSKKVILNINPKVSLTGVKSGEVIEKSLGLGADTNFIASYVIYEIINLDKNKTTITEKLDPEGIYNWNAFVHESGNYSFKVMAYDENNEEYHSETIISKVMILPSLSVGGVKEDMEINKPINISTIRNFHVSETEYILKDPKTGKEESLKKLPYGNYNWFPGPEYSGTKELLVRVKDPSGKVYSSESRTIKLEGSPKLILEGVGPGQVITSEVIIKSKSNVKLTNIKYFLINPENGSEKLLASKENPVDEFTFIPSKENSGYKNIKVIGDYDGKTIQSEEIPVRIYLDKTYGPMPIIEKDKFLNLASKLGKESWKETGMSAALQTAQAILETGWGQSVPVDKYTGQASNNLFGIKGKGVAGSVISNTWEEYNGTTFRIDAEFRAYNNINESWGDHKKLLLNGERYGIFRDVMHNSTRGAWALRRAGYATDSQYPIKLMNIIDQYNLKELDKVGI